MELKRRQFIRALLAGVAACALGLARAGARRVLRAAAPRRYPGPLRERADARPRPPGPWAG